MQSTALMADVCFKILSVVGLSLGGVYFFTFL